MPTLHWFHTLGNQRRRANYHLTPELVTRLADHPACPWPELSATTSDGRYRVYPALSPTAAILHLLGDTRPDVQVRLHRIDTKELHSRKAYSREKGEVVDVDSTCVQDLGEDLPLWVSPCPRYRLDGSDACRLDCGFSPEASCPARDHNFGLEDRSPDAVADLVGWVLDTEFEPGDLVFIESTAGLRPIQMALTLSQSLLQATRPDVHFIGTTYAELGGTKRVPPSKVAWVHSATGGPINLSPVYDQTHLLDMPRWASAADDISATLDTTALRRLLGGATVLPDASRAALEHRLDDLSTTFHLAWPEDLLAPLDKLHTLLEDLSERTGPTKLIGKLLQDTLGELYETRPTGTSSELTLERVLFHLAVADALARSGRLGDCLRVVREALVSRMVLARGDTRSWTTMPVREAANRKLNRSKLPNGGSDLWKEVKTFRNPASHANLRADSPEYQDLRDFVLGTDTTDSLVRRARALCTDAESWQVQGTVAPGAEVLWLGPAEHLPDEETRARLEAWLENFDAAGATATPTEASGPYTGATKNWTGLTGTAVPGKNWAASWLKRRCKQWPTLRHLILLPGLELTSVVLISGNAHWEGILVWSCEVGHGGPDLRPLFDAGQRALARPGPA